MLPESEHEIVHSFTVNAVVKVCIERHCDSPVVLWGDRCKYHEDRYRIEMEERDADIEWWWEQEQENAEWNDPITDWEYKFELERDFYEFGL